MGFRRVIALLVSVVGVLAMVYIAIPYARALSLIVRAADLGGQVEAFANDRARHVTIRSPHMVPTRQGDVPARFYEPDGEVRRTVLLLPGIHSMGIEEPRLRALANDLAGSGVRVMTLALPDLQRYQVTAQSSDVIEDAIGWMAGQPDLAPDEHRRRGRYQLCGRARRSSQQAGHRSGTTWRSSSHSAATATFRAC